MMLPKATPIFQASYLEAQSPEVTSAVQYSIQPAIEGLVICEATDFSIRKCFLAAGLTMLRHIPCRRSCGPVHKQRRRPTVLQYVLKERLLRRLYRLLVPIDILVASGRLKTDLAHARVPNASSVGGGRSALSRSCLVVQAR